MGSMNRTAQTTASHMIAAFDGDAFIEQVLQAATAQITALIPVPGVIETAAVREILDRHLAPAVEPATGRPLISSLYELAPLLAAAAARDAETLANPRYADAPDVTAWLHLKASDGERTVTVDSRKVTIPAGWLARQDRDRLHEAAEWDADRGWIARELGLIADHDGPCALDFEVGEEYDLLTEWLTATENAGADI